MNKQPYTVNLLYNIKYNTPEVIRLSDGLVITPSEDKEGHEREQ